MYIYISSSGPLRICANIHESLRPLQEAARGCRDVPAVPAMPKLKKDMCLDNKPLLNQFRSSHGSQQTTALRQHNNPRATT